MQSAAGFRIDKSVDAPGFIFVVYEIGKIIRLAGHFVQLQILGNQRPARHFKGNLLFHPLPVFLHPVHTVFRYLVGRNAIVFGTVRVHHLVHPADKIGQGKRAAHVLLFV